VIGDELVEDWEGCLSIPDIRGKVPRNRRVRVRGFDRQGKPIDMELEEFPADSLEFKLYAFIDLNKGGGIGTDLRIAILDAFDDAGIRSPLPRTDVTLRNIDWLRGIVAEYASAGSNGRTTSNGQSWLAPVSRTPRSEGAV